MNQIALSTTSLAGYGLHKIFQFARQAGFDGIDLALVNGEFDYENAEYVKTLQEAFKLPVLSITGYERKMNSKKVDALFKIAKVLGTKTINFFPPLRTEKDGDWFSDYLPKCSQMSNEIFSCVVNVEPKTFLFFIPEYKDATLTAIKKNTGMTALMVSNVDSESGIDLLKTFSILGKSIKNVILSDRMGTKTGLLPGQGGMPLESLLIKLKEGGYDGIFTLKVDPKELGCGSDATVLKQLEYCLNYFKRFNK